MSERLDERLRAAAQTYRRLGNHTAEGMFLEAADTICELQAENAALLEECDGWKKLCVDQEVIHVMHEDALDNEIAKLRKLLTFYLGCLTKGHVNCDSCAFAEDVCEHGRMVIDWARELGVEVDE